MNPFAPAIFAAENPCVCCAPPGECACALLIPPFASPYADYATAETAIAGDVVSCMVYNQFTGSPTYSSYTATFDGTTLAIDFVAALLGGGWFSVSLKAGSTLSVPYSVTYSGTVDEFTQIDSSIEVYLCDGTGFYSDSNQVIGEGTLSGTFSVPADSVDQTYYIFVTANSSGDPGTETITASFDVNCDDAFWVNPVIALWDDSGTTRQLEACPKLYLPPLTESTGDWNADCASADAVLTDALQVSNCVGFYDATIGLTADTFTATDGGASLAFGGTWTSATGGFGDCWGSVNAESGETLSIAFTGGTSASAEIYDDTGTLVESLGPSGSTLVSAALPYTGRYTVRARAFASIPDPPFTSASITITSSGTVSVNPIQSLYDISLTCPALLDCGDACP